MGNVNRNDFYHNNDEKNYQPPVLGPQEQGDDDSTLNFNKSQQSLNNFNMHQSQTQQNQNLFHQNLKLTSNKNYFNQKNQIHNDFDNQSYLMQQNQNNKMVNNFINQIQNQPFKEMKKTIH